METSTLQFTEDMKQLLKDCIGKNLKDFSIHHYEHQKKASNSAHYNSFQNVWLNIEGETYNVHNEYTDEPRSFFNSPESKIIEDTPCFSFFKRTYEETPYMQESFALDTISVGEKITDIQIATDTYVETRSDGTQEKLITDIAVIFILEKRKIVFERSVWFSEDVDITVMPIGNPVELLSNNDGEEMADIDDETGEQLSEIDFSREIKTIGGKTK